MRWCETDSFGAGIDAVDRPFDGGTDVVAKVASLLEKR